MIKIFNPTDTDFTSAGNICIKPLKCIETKSKSLNGWNLSVEVDINYQEYIKKDYLVVCKTKSLSNPQAFRINSNIEYTSNKISFTADHVYCDSENYFLLDVRPTKLNAISSLEYVNERTDKKSPFFVYSDIDSISTSYFIRKNLLEAWEIFEERYSGYFQFDNWNVNLKQNISRDTGIIISYSQYLESLNIIEDWSNVVTRLYPTGPNGIMLDEKYLDADVQYDVPYTKTIQFDSDIEFDLQTDENLKQELKEKAVKYINENKYPKISYEVQSNVNQELDIGYMVQIKHPLVDITVEVIEYQYDLNLGKTISLVFGNFTRNVKKKFDSIKQEINSQAEKISSQGKLIQEQTNLINSLNKNGHVYISDNEVLILDKLPKENAKNVWRWGLGGLGFSSQGYEGPFSTAITQDGKINADFILAGKINTNLIEGYDQLVTKVSKTEETVEDITTTTQTSTGGNSLYLKEALESNALEYSIDGKCEQATRSGKNLANIKAGNYSLNGITLTINNGEILLNGTATAATTFTGIGEFLYKTGKTYSGTFIYESGSCTDYGAGLYLSNSSTSNVNIGGGAGFRQNQSRTFNITSKTEDIQEYFYIVVNKNTVINNYRIKIQIVEGTTADYNFEQYGASPSPDYPSEIKTIKGIRNLLNLNVPTSTTNGITCTNNNDGSITINGHTTKDFRYYLTNDNITFEKGKKYTISAKILSGSCTNYSPSAPWAFMFMADFHNNATATYINSTTKEIERTFDGSNASAKPNLWFGWNSSTTENDAVFNDLRVQFMVEEGDIKHSNVPYGTYEKIKVTGKNVFDSSLFEEFTTGLKFINLQLKPNTSYTMSSNYLKNAAGTYGNLFFYNTKGSASTGTSDVSLGISRTITTASDGIGRIAYRDVDNEYSNESTDYWYIVEEGTEATNHEPYKEKEVLIDLAKENLFDDSNLINHTGGMISEVLTLEPNTFYTFESNIPKTYGVTSAFIFFNSGNTAYTVTDTTGVWNGQTRTVKSDNNGNVCVSYRYQNDTPFNNYHYKIYEGYSPYHELNSIGETKDKLEILNGVVDIQKRIGKIILNGSEDWSSYTHTSGTILYRIYLKPMKLDDSNIIVMSNYARAVANNDWTANRTDNIVFGGDDGKLQFIIPNITTLADFKSWLKVNPVTVYYILNEPETITLPNTNISLYENVNHVTLVEDLETTTSIKYLRKTPISGEYALNQDLNKTNSNLADTNNQLNQTQSDINATNTNLNNNHYNKEQIDSMNSTTTKNITQIRNTMEQNITSTNASISKIQETIENGVSKVITTTGTFDENGLNISKSGQQMSTTVDWEGLEVIRDKGKSTESEVLTVRPDKVASKNMEVRTYFTQKPIRNEQCVSITDGKSVGYGTYWIGEE